MSQPASVTVLRPQGNPAEATRTDAPEPATEAYWERMQALRDELRLLQGPRD